MTRKQRHQREEQLRLPPSPPPRNPFAQLGRARTGAGKHDKTPGALRREKHMQLRDLEKGGWRNGEE